MINNTEYQFQPYTPVGKKYSILTSDIYKRTSNDIKMQNFCYLFEVLQT